MVSSHTTPRSEIHGKWCDLSDSTQQMSILAKLLPCEVFKLTEQFQRRILSISTAPKLPAGLSVGVSVHTCISHVMDFIKDDPRHLSHNF